MTEARNNRGNNKAHMRLAILILKSAMDVPKDFEASQCDIALRDMCEHWR